MYVDNVKHKGTGAYVKSQKLSGLKTEGRMFSQFPSVTSLKVNGSMTIILATYRKERNQETKGQGKRIQ